MPEIRKKTTGAFAKLEARASCVARGDAFIHNQIAGEIAADNFVRRPDIGIVPDLEIGLGTTGKLHLSSTEVNEILDLIVAFQGAHYVGRVAALDLKTLRARR